MLQPAVDIAAVVRRFGLVAGPLLALTCYLVLPQSYLAADGSARALAGPARAALAMMCWMAVWWMTEAVAIEVTALLPVVAFPLLGVATLGATTAAYGSDVVFLFLGGFVLAGAIQRCGLDRRIAFATLSLVGGKPERIVGGIMVATAFLSMWVSNTATAAMMVPIAQSIIALDDRTAAADGHADRDRRNFALALLLGVAYAASIGGLGTLVGSPPNGIAARFVEQTYGFSVSFAGWLAIGLPIVIVLLPFAWWLLARRLFPTRQSAAPQGRAWIEAERRGLGPLGSGERVTLIVFALTVALWVLRPLLAAWETNGARPLAGLTDAGIAIGGAIALFLVPVAGAGGKRAMDWQTAQALPWGVLVLFGGGLALAAAIETSGAAAFIGSQARVLGSWPLWAVLIAIVAATTFLSEVTSNTAQVATMIPILAALAPAIGTDPIPLVVACTLASSLAFMLPVGTPPNAIVFGSGRVTMPDMCRAGFLLNLAGIAIVAAFTYLALPALLALVFN